MSQLSHFDETGASRMVDVGSKEVTLRRARAEALVKMAPETMALVREKKAAKGDVLEIARLAGIMATKRTANLIPLCHSLGIDSASVDFELLDETTMRIESAVSVNGRTGVEMEAMTAVSVAALTVYDMCKSVDRGIRIEGIRLVRKRGGRSGDIALEE